MAPSRHAALWASLGGLGLLASLALAPAPEGALPAMRLLEGLPLVAVWEQGNGWIAPQVQAWLLLAGAPLGLFPWLCFGAAEIGVSRQKTLLGGVVAVGGLLAIAGATVAEPHQIAGAVLAGLAVVAGHRGVLENDQRRLAWALLWASLAGIENPGPVPAAIWLGVAAACVARLNPSHLVAAQVGASGAVVMVAGSVAPSIELAWPFLPGLALAVAPLPLATRGSLIGLSLLAALWPGGGLAAGMLVAWLLPRAEFTRPTVAALAVAVIAQWGMTMAMRPPQRDPVAPPMPSLQTVFLDQEALAAIPEDLLFHPTGGGRHERFQASAGLNLLRLFTDPHGAVLGEGLAPLTFDGEARRDFPASWRRGRGGWQGAYFLRELPEADLVRRDPFIFIEAPDAPVDQRVSIRWTGNLIVPQAGVAVFSLETTGTAQLLVGNEAILVADGQRVTEEALLAPGLHPIAVEVESPADIPGIRLAWSTPWTGGMALLDERHVTQAEPEAPYWWAKPAREPEGWLYVEEASPPASRQPSEWTVDGNQRTVSSSAGNLFHAIEVEPASQAGEAAPGIVAVTLPSQGGIALFAPTGERLMPNGKGLVAGSASQAALEGPHDLMRADGRLFLTSAEEPIALIYR